MVSFRSGCPTLAAFLFFCVQSGIARCPNYKNSENARIHFHQHRRTLVMKIARLIFALLLAFVLQAAWFTNPAHGKTVPSQPNSIQGGNLTVEVFDDGSYALRSTAIHGDVLRSEVEVDTAAGTLKSSLYPNHSKSIAPFTDELGSGHLLTVTHTGLPGTPDLICEFRVYDDQPWGDIQRKRKQHHRKPHRDACHSRGKEQQGRYCAELNGPASADRVLSDDYSENPVRLMDFGEPKDGVHLGFRESADLQPKERAESFSGSAF